MAAALDEAQKAAPGIAVTASIDDGFPAPVLLHHSRRAATVVLGDRASAISAA